MRYSASEKLEIIRQHDRDGAPISRWEHEHVLEGRATKA